MGHEYKAWLGLVDSIIEAETGLSMLDLPDYDYFGDWQDGLDADETAYAALEAAGYPADF